MNFRRMLRRKSGVIGALIIVVQILWSAISAIGNFQTAAAIVVWLENNRIPRWLPTAVVLVIGFALVLRALREDMPKGKANEEPASSSPPITVSPTISPAISLTISQTNGPTVERQRAPKAPRVPVAKQGPNIVFVRTDTVDAILQETPGGMASLVESPPSEHSRALAVVYFRNQAGGGAVAANNVNAEVTYYDSQGQEILSRLGGCWLDDSMDMVDFSVGRTQALIVATVKDGKTILLWNRRVPYDEGFSGDTVELDATESKREVKLIVAKLIGEWGDLLCRVHLGYSIAQDRPQISRQK